MEILRVSTKSNPNSVAGALAGVLREEGSAELQAVGAGCFKSSSKSRSYSAWFCSTKWN